MADEETTEPTTSELTEPTTGEDTEPTEPTTEEQVDGQTEEPKPEPTPEPLSPTMAAVHRKLNVTWRDENTDARVQDVVDAVSPRLASLLGYHPFHVFSKTDGDPWFLFLNGCLYEFSDAWDDFVNHYEREIQSVRLRIIATGYDPDSDTEAEVNQIMNEIYEIVGDEDADSQE